MLVVLESQGIAEDGATRQRIIKEAAGSDFLLPQCNQDDKRKLITACYKQYD